MLRWYMPISGISRLWVRYIFLKRLPRLRRKCQNSSRGPTWFDFTVLYNKKRFTLRLASRFPESRRADVSGSFRQC